MNSWPAVGDDEYDFAQARLAYKTDLCSMRLTCTHFSKLHELKVALFYDFQLYVTRESLDRLNSLSKHPDLRRFVKTIAFMVFQLDNRHDFAE